MDNNRCPLFIILIEQRFCIVSVVKINKTKLSKLIFSKLVDLKLCLYNNPL
jgi:hypothetical protein